MAGKDKHIAATNFADRTPASLTTLVSASEYRPEPGLMQQQLGNRLS
jgi:hypothetical protein